MRYDIATIHPPLQELANWLRAHEEVFNLHDGGFTKDYNGFGFEKNTVLKFGMKETEPSGRVNVLWEAGVSHYQPAFPGVIKDEVEKYQLGYQRYRPDRKGFSVSIPTCAELIALLDKNLANPDPNPLLPAFV